MFGRLGALSGKMRGWRSEDAACPVGNLFEKSGVALQRGVTMPITDQSGFSA